MSALKQLTYKNFDVFFVDNSKTDDISKIISAEGYEVKEPKFQFTKKKKGELESRLLVIVGIGSGMLVLYSLFKWKKFIACNTKRKKKNH